MEDDWGEASPNLAYLIAAGIREEAARAWLDEVSALRRECGCKLGAAFFLLSLAAIPVAFLAGRVTITFGVVALAILLSILSLGFGKWLGQYRARRLLARRVADMRDAVARVGRRETAYV